MSKNETLTAQKREGTGKGVARQLRQNGRVPAVLYGRDLESMHLSLDVREAEHLFYAISVDNTIVDLKVDGEKEAYPTLVREIQTHPWKATLLHVDFLRIQKGVAVDVDVPVHLVGVPVGVKLSGGNLEQIVHDLPVRCIPSKIPESIEIDVSELDLGEVLHISDIKLDDDIEVRIAPEQTLCSVAHPSAEEEVVVDEEELELAEGEEAPEGTDPAAEAEGGGDDSGDGES